MLLPAGIFLSWETGFEGTGKYLLREQKNLVIL